MNICFIVDYYPPDRLGGVGESAKYLKDALENAGHEVFVLTTGKKSEDSEIERNVIRLSKQLSLFPFALFFTITSLIKRLKIELIHVHHSIGITALFWKHILGKKFPAVVTTYKCSRPHIAESIKPIIMNNKIIFKPRFYEFKTKISFTLLKIADKYLAKVSDYLTSNSEDTKSKNIQTLKIKEDKIRTVHNGVDLKKFDHSLDGNPIREKYKIPQDGTLLLYVGGFSVRKRVPLLFHILKEITTKRNNVFLLVAGSAKGYIEDFKKIVKELGIEDNVVFSGFVKNTELPSYYSAADIMIVPSEYEPFGIINIEAMAMAKPVIATTAGGMGDIIIDGETGYLVEKDDIAGLINRINHLINSSNREKMGLNGYRRVCDKFTWEIIVKKYLNVYEDALNLKKMTNFVI